MARGTALKIALMDRRCCFALDHRDWIHRLATASKQRDV
jgi:hypothetical protein